MRQTKWLVAAILSPTVLIGAEAQKTCPMGPFPMLTAHAQQTALWHAVSTNAELVAPDSTAGRRRISAPPSTPPPGANIVDTDLFDAMSKAGITPTSLAGDEEFLRRVTLDLTGQIPDAATVSSFTADRSPGKRALMINQLLASDAYVDRWTMWFGDLVQNVQVSANAREFPQGRNAYYGWIRSAIAADKPYDQMVRELIAARGDSFANGSPNYWVRQLQPNGPIQDTYDNLAASSADKFLGMPLLCLSCHNGLNHLELVNLYLQKKTRQDFWANAAFFAKTRSTRMAGDPNNPNVKKYDVEDNPAGQYLLNTTSGNKTPRQPQPGQPNSVSPAFLLDGGTPGGGEGWRDAFGRLLTSNPQFARAAVNYIWKEMFGMGIVEPVNSFDPFRQDPNNIPAGSTLQPTNPQLLTDLQNAFIASHYDLKALLRLIANSSTYQLASSYTPGVWNEQWTPYFARHYPHRLTAEMTLDAILRATSVPYSFNVTGLGTVTKAMALPDTLEARNNAYGRFLDEFGRGDRDTDARSNDSSIAQSLSLMNDATVVVNRVHKATAGSTVAKTLAATSDPGTIVDQLYLTTLSRKPSAAERASSIAYLAGGTLQARTEDLQWVLLNQLEFLFD